MVTTPTMPAIVRGRVRHARTHPIRHGLTFGTHLWLLDLGTPPPDHLLARFPVADHFDGRGDSLFECARSFATDHGATLRADDRILMLAAARSLGHAFNPLSVFWCLGPSGNVRWAIMEIHNTYGQRHAHLVQPDADGRLTFAKAFYVSPFFEVDGDYRVRLELDDDRIAVAVLLQQQGRTVFSASFAGHPAPATLPRLVMASLRTPFVSYQTTIRIRVHGIWLWLRRLPVVPRPQAKADLR